MEYNEKEVLDAQPLGAGTAEDPATEIIIIDDIIPIWRDTFYIVDADELRYSIYLDESPIFHGKAYRMPDEDELKININKICSNYLGADINEALELYRDEGVSPNGYPIDGNIKMFTLRSDSDTILARYRFINDWSYDRHFTISTDRSEPINGHYAEGMLPLGAEITGDGFVLVEKPQNYSTLVCGPRYCLYYENSLGGFDSFLCEGKSIHKDSIESHNYSRSFTNTRVDHEMKRYVNELKGTYELHTGFLTDEQSECLVKNLLPSNQVYMHDLKTGDIFPVVITNKDVEYLNYKNNKKFSHTINVTVSQNRIRK